MPVTHRQTAQVLPIILTASMATVRSMSVKQPRTFLCQDGFHTQEACFNSPQFLRAESSIQPHSFLDHSFPDFQRLKGRLTRMNTTPYVTPNLTLSFDFSMESRSTGETDRAG
ncbi:hypothetical protein C8R43DRAFT_1043013 [Mycena crocata]|nr:hypothetical protein C8R43DRAFT_1043013 [Mycena crocata]